MEWGDRRSVETRAFLQGAVQAMAAAIIGHQQSSQVVFTALHVLLPFVSGAHCPRVPTRAQPCRPLASRMACTARLRWTERCRRWLRWVNAARRWARSCSARRTQAALEHSAELDVELLALDCVKFMAADEGNAGLLLRQSAVGAVSGATPRFAITALAPAVFAQASRAFSAAPREVAIGERVVEVLAALAHHERNAEE